MKLNREEIEKIIPHRDPFLFLDAIVSFDPNSMIVAEKSLTGDEWFFGGHFPGNPVLPGVIMVEMMAQVGAVGILAQEKGKWMYLVGCERVRFKALVTPPVRLTIASEIGPRRRNFGKAPTWIERDGKKVCEGILAYALVPKDG